MKPIDCSSGKSLPEETASSFNDAVLLPFTQPAVAAASLSGYAAGSGGATSGRHGSDVWRQRWKQGNDVRADATTGKSVFYGAGLSAGSLKSAGLASMTFMPFTGPVYQAASGKWSALVSNSGQMRRELDSVLRTTAYQLVYKGHVWQIAMQLQQRLAEGMIQSVAWRVQPGVRAPSTSVYVCPAHIVSATTIPISLLHRDVQLAKKGVDYAVGKLPGLSTRPAQACPHKRDITRCVHAREAAIAAMAEDSDETGQIVATCGHCSRLVLIGHATLSIPASGADTVADGAIAHHTGKPHYAAIRCRDSLPPPQSEVMGKAQKIMQSAPARLAERLKSLAPVLLSDEKPNDSQPVASVSDAKGAPPPVTRSPLRDQGSVKAALLRHAGRLPTR